MSRLTESTITGIIKRKIRHLRSDDAPATLADLKAELREQCDDPERAVEVLERLRKQGEIYTYPADRGDLVKITEDRI